MLKRTAFSIEINGEDGWRAVEAARSAFRAVNEEFEDGGDDNKGSIVCQFLRSSDGGVLLKGQFLPHKYAARIAAIFTEFRNDLLAQERAAAPIEFEPQSSKYPSQEER